MAAVVSRVVLGICAALAVVGGAALVVMVVVYFGADQYVPELQVGGWGTLAGMCGLGVYVGGAFRAHLVARIGLGLGLAGAGYVASTIVASLVSLMADRGGPRGTLEDGTIGFIWVLAGAFLAWRAATGRWPVEQTAV
ncbi:hypothetical protein ETD86_53790 [Nonomuraea turkmeniaca]|uniref:Uncharacterized protein n=1 Tax=Nonomuraea turkmeniaca TaxID=103838 RepID=A0A5S4EUS9_9ACTN|nr:hypothetical protein [Nonomuraea turkmeniaca]TMR03759.1 hypothetical protein ETD86_53790 [Nonomuraea turkmeniaca]